MKTKDRLLENIPRIVRTYTISTFPVSTHSYYSDYIQDKTSHTESELQDKYQLRFQEDFTDYDCYTPQGDIIVYILEFRICAIYDRRHHKGVVLYTTRRKPR